MSRAARQRLLGVATVVLLLALAAWQWRHDRDTAPGTLLTLTPAAITRIDLGFAGQPMQHFARRDDHWWHTDGTPTRADDGWLGELAATAAAPVAAWRDARDFDPARIGLTPAQATLVLDGHTLAFGAIDATAPLVYVQSGTRIGWVSLRYLPRADAGRRLRLH